MHLLSRSNKFSQRLMIGYPMSPSIFGMVMISFGLLSLLLAQVQHQRAMKELKAAYRATKRSISSILSVLILVFGLFLFLAAWLRQ